ncbi:MULTISPECIES: lipase secretion chaperone [Marinobacter]|uniref:lipase secretion chaperone n=1 Tax=Marinobacter TaxID=2742 RepID=UPI001247970C|nr:MULTISPECIES: lipase secretion chaperone [Marinobacter]MBL3555886.1 lipase [Marinobacter sp. JB05H06]
MRGLLRFATVALLAIAALFAGMLIYFSDESATPADSAASAVSGSQSDFSQSLTEKGAAPSKLVGDPGVAIPDALPASLEGTSVPGGWAETDSNGSLVPTPQLRQLFEYYLAALGEETLPQLVARIEQALARLQEPARSEAMAILGNYLDYKLAVGELETSYANAGASSPEEMQQQMAEIRALRRAWMDAQTAEAFFASDEALDRFQVEQLRIRTDDSLSDDEREQALARAEGALPEPIREARRETRKFTDYHKARSELADDPEALSDWRKAHFGEQAARRLEQAEAEQQAWDNKWQAYSEELAEIESLGVAGPEREAAIDALRDHYFEGAEKLRAEALDSIR